MNLPQAQYWWDMLIFGKNTPKGGGGIGTKSFPIVLKGLWDVKRGLRNDIGRPHIEVI